MKKFNGYIGFLLLMFLVLSTSCRKEESLFVGTVPEDRLLADSSVASLLLNVSSQDGSKDNIIDYASCVTIELPVSVIVNDLEIIVDSTEDFDTIEVIFDQSDTDADTLEIVFPITITLQDFTQISVANSEEFQVYTETCNDEGIEDDDIECIDIQYPITVSTFNANSETFDTKSIMDDNGLFGFLKGLSQNDIVEIEFPITLSLNDGTDIEVSDLAGLEAIIESSKDACDEDDDNDFDDDDCDDCTTEELLSVWSACSEWTVRKLNRNGVDMEILFNTYVFSFQENGVLIANSDIETFYGTWSAEGTSNDITIVMDIPALDDFNAAWHLDEIGQSSGEDRINLREGDDRLRFESTCSGGGGPMGGGPTPPKEAAEVLESDLWGISSYFNGDIDLTSSYEGYGFDFVSDGTIAVSGTLPSNGTWSEKNGGTVLELDFGTEVPFLNLNQEWRVVSVSDTQVEFQHIEVGTGTNSSLVFMK